jgi:sucrose-6-phosphate hydrolase SacC (GH32 family)
MDRTSIELFAQNGEVQIAKVFRPDNLVRNIVYVGTTGGEAVIENAKIWEMKSVWKR